MSNVDVQITFTYRTYLDDEWHSLQFTAEQYYDTRDRQPDERLDLHFVADHLDPRRYIDQPSKLIRNIIVTEYDPIENQQRTVDYTYWGNGECQLNRYRSTVPEEKECRLILQTKAKETDTVVTVNLLQERDSFSVDSYSVLVKDRPIDCFPDIEKGKSGLIR